MKGNSYPPYPPHVHTTANANVRNKLPCSKAHIIGGFSTCFSSKDICRKCHAQYSDLDSRIHDFEGESPHSRWTIEEYDSLHKNTNTRTNISDVTANENLFNEFSEPLSDDSQEEMSDSSEEEAKKKFGVKTKCVFNVLQTFHCVESMPPDSLHDLMEGVIPQDLLGILLILEDKGWFKLSEYNTALNQFNYSRQEASSKPQLVPLSNKVKKLSGKAVSHWVHIRIFPYILMMKNWIRNGDDPVLTLGIMLADITSRLTAEAFRSHEVNELEDLIVEYLNLRKRLLEEFPLLGNAKPKHHFLVHYGDAIRLFGPPSSYWSGRYESKHRIAKAFADSSKCFINVSYTIAYRQQMRMCSIYYRGMYGLMDFKLPDSPFSKEDLGNSLIEMKIRSLMSGAKDLVTYQIEYNGRLYKVNDLIILNREDYAEIQVGMIKGFLIRKKTIYVIVLNYTAVQNYLGVFESSMKSENLKLVNFKTLEDTYPLFRRGTENKFLLILHHFVSFTHK